MLHPMLNIRLRAHSRRHCRRGAAMLETAISLLAFLILLFGMLDIGVAVIRHHLLTHAANAVCRQVIVHGSLATKLGVWGPGSYSGTASSATPISTTAANHLAGLDTSQVTVRVDWIDGGNDRRDQRVRVILSMPYQPIATFIFGNPRFTLSATAVMPIAH